MVHFIRFLENPAQVDSSDESQQGEKIEFYVEAKGKIEDI